MKIKLMSLALVLALVVALFGSSSPASAVGYGTKFVTSITYQNIGSDDAELSITFYPSDGSAPIPFSPAEGALPVNAGSSLYVGNVAGLAGGFTGSAVMASSQPLATILVQVPQAPSTVKNRPLSSGLSQGYASVRIPTVLKGVFSTNTVFVVQNADTVANDLTVNFIPVSGATITLTVTNLGVGVAKYYDMGQIANTEVPAGFNGSVTISAKKAGTADDGAIVATSLELSTAGDNVYAFEGVSEGGNTLYMPSAFCNYRGGKIDSAYAVQNIDPTNDAVVTVAYSSGTSEGPFTVAPGAKKSLLGCGDDPTNPVNANEFLGSATITSVGGQIVGIGKITGDGISSAFNGLTAGYQKVALPYIRWTVAHWADGTRQRSNIAIQNVGAGPLAAGSVSVKFYNKDGVLVGTMTNPNEIAVGGKFSTNPSTLDPEFGVSGTQFGGGAIVEGPTGSALAVLVRVETFNVAAGTGSLGEDYNGVPVQ